MQALSTRKDSSEEPCDYAVCLLMETYLTASVEVEIDGRMYTLKAAVAESPSWYALFAIDVKT